MSTILTNATFIHRIPSILYSSPSQNGSPSEDEPVTNATFLFRMPIYPFRKVRLIAEIYTIPTSRPLLKTFLKYGRSLTNIQPDGEGIANGTREPGFNWGAEGIQDTGWLDLCDDIINSYDFDDAENKYGCYVNVYYTRYQPASYGGTFRCNQMMVMFAES